MCIATDAGVVELCQGRIIICETCPVECRHIEACIDHRRFESYDESTRWIHRCKRDKPAK
jgi:hypothetical protein